MKGLNEKTAGGKGEVETIIEGTLIGRKEEKLKRRDAIVDLRRERILVLPEIEEEMAERDDVI